MAVATQGLTNAASTTEQPPRLHRLRAAAMHRGDGTGGAPGARALAMWRAWCEHPGCSWAQHRAFTLRCLAEDAPLSVGDDELLLGEHLFSRQTEALDFGNWGDAAQRQLQETDLTAEQKESVRQFMQRYLERRSAPYHGVGEECPEFARHSGAGVYWAGGWSENHSVRDFAKGIRLGWGGLRREVEAHLGVLSPEDPECTRRRAFYVAELAVCEAGLALGKRYAERARQAADAAVSDERRQALLEAAELCERASESGATTFREATQMLWFAHVLTCAEDGINANSIGRMDQYLWPYYEADVAEGRLTREEALDWMIELGCKLYQEYDVQQLCLGGQTPAGDDACNELTHLVLEATERLDFIRCVSVRLHAGTPEALLQRCARMNARGGGIPFYFSDDEIIPALTARGIPVEEARDYAPIGCVEITLPGKASPHAVSGRVNLAKCLELALFNGGDPVSKRQVGPETGSFESFGTFDELLAAYKAQVEYFSRWMAYGCNLGELRQRERGPLPCLSLLTDDCLATGRDISEGGARYQYHSIMAFGIPNAADGLMALKKLVFDRERAGVDGPNQSDRSDPSDRSELSPAVAAATAQAQSSPVDRAELLEALRTNFERAEPLRQRLLNEAPKYGNDEPEVDELAADVTRHFVELLDTFRSPLGARYFVHLFTFRWNIDAGRETGATPDGRRAGEPLAYSVSPQQGCDRRGLTAMMNSLARLPHDMAAGSSSAIIELDPSVVKGDDGASILTQVIRSGLASGIGQMQFNVTNADTLRAAQREPARHAHLQVRVAGFSFEFVKLDEAMQEHIIARTKHAQ